MGSDDTADRSAALRSDFPPLSLFSHLSCFADDREEGGDSVREVLSDV